MNFKSAGVKLDYFAQRFRNHLHIQTFGNPNKLWMEKLFIQNMASVSSYVKTQFANIMCHTNDHIQMLLKLLCPN